MDKVLTLTNIYKRSIEGSLDLVVNVADDGDLCFRYPDLGVLLITLDATNDPEFMHLYYPVFFDDQSELDENELMSICNKINGRCKGIKVFFANHQKNKVCVSVQMLVAGPDELPTELVIVPIMKRAVSMISTAVKNFAQEVKQRRINKAEIKDPKLH